MNILIVGCGKVGSRLAGVLSRQGHDVSVLDRLAANLELLPPDFSGFTTTGVPIDQDVLRRAGIENCDALAAVTQDDNVNIMVSQLASDIFHVPKVLARVYDPQREDVFSHFGLNTVCPTNLTVAAVCSALTEDDAPQQMHFGAHTVSFSTIPVPRDYIGMRVSDIDFEPGEVLYAVEHADKTVTLVGLDDLVLKKNERLIFSRLLD